MRGDDPLIRNANEVKSVSYGFGAGGYGVGPFGGGPQASVLVDGVQTQLITIIRAAAKFYRDEIDRLGIQ